MNLDWMHLRRLVDWTLRGELSLETFQFFPESWTFFPDVSGVWSAGTVMGLIDSVVSCDELCSSIVEEAENIIRDRLTNSIVTVSDAK